MENQKSKEIVIAGGAEWYFGEVGESIPEDPQAPLPNFHEVGYITQDGLKFNRAVGIGEIMALQRRSAVRRFVNTEEIGFNGSLEQWNGENFKIAFGGGEIVEPQPGIFGYHFPEGDDNLAEYATVLRWNDGDRAYQLGFDRGNVSDAVEFALKRDEAGTLPIAFKALAGDDSDSLGVSFFTTDLSFQTAGS